MIEGFFKNPGTSHPGLVRWHGLFNHLARFGLCVVMDGSVNGEIADQDARWLIIHKKRRLPKEPPH